MMDNKNIAIITCCMDDWGGSEELWARAIPFMKDRGYHFTLYKDQINSAHPEIKQLQREGVTCIELNKPKSLLKKVIDKVLRKAGLWPVSPFYTNSPFALAFRKELNRKRPALAIIAQGINFDGSGYAYQCMQLGIPYCIIAQKAVDFFWPSTGERSLITEVFQKARKCYFVSNHNLRLTEEQFGMRFANAEVVWNPVKISKRQIPHPAKADILHFACVARLFVIDKGQDILLRIFSKEPWKSRPVRLSFVGSGHDETGIKALAALLEVKNVAFVGHLANISELWETAHALVLPSRSEGMALSVLEAMAAGRTVIVSTAGGHEDLIQDGVNGFIGDATEKDFTRALERAWELRGQWEAIGERAHEFIIRKLPDSPERDFADSILKIIE